jgi:hypothetical protein
MHFNATCGKAGKEFVISIAVITEAVDKDNLGNWFSIGLAACYQSHRVKGEPTNLPCLRIKGHVPNLMCSLDFGRHFGVLVCLVRFWEEQEEKRWVKHEAELSWSLWRAEFLGNTLAVETLHLHKRPLAPKCYFST